MDTICSIAPNHRETDFKHRLWNKRVDIRGVRSLGGFKIQCVLELASAITDMSPPQKLKIHYKEKTYRMKT